MIWFLRWVDYDIQFFYFRALPKSDENMKNDFYYRERDSETERYYDVKVILQSIEWY